MYHPAITEYIAQQEAPLDLQVPAAKKRLAEQEKAERITHCLVSMVPVAAIVTEAVHNCRS